MELVNSMPLVDFVLLWLQCFNRWHVSISRFYHLYFSHAHTAMCPHQHSCDSSCISRHPGHVCSTEYLFSCWLSTKSLARAPHSTMPTDVQQLGPPCSNWNRVLYVHCCVIWLLRSDCTRLTTAFSAWSCLYSFTQLINNMHQSLICTFCIVIKSYYWNFQLLFFVYSSTDCLLWLSVFDLYRQWYHNCAHFTIND